MQSKKEHFEELRDRLNRNLALEYQDLERKYTAAEAMLESVIEHPQAVEKSAYNAQLADLELKKNIISLCQTANHIMHTDSESIAWSALGSLFSNPSRTIDSYAFAKQLHKQLDGDSKKHNIPLSTLALESDAVNRIVTNDALWDTLLLSPSILPSVILNYAPSIEEAILKIRSAEPNSPKPEILNIIAVLNYDNARKTISSLIDTQEFSDAIIYLANSSIIQQKLGIESYVGAIEELTPPILEFASHLLYNLNGLGDIVDHINSNDTQNLIKDDAPHLITALTKSKVVNSLRNVILNSSALNVLASLVPDLYKPLVTSTILQSLVDIALKSETLAEVEELLPQISKILAKEELEPGDLTSLLTAGISIAKNSATEIQALAGNQAIISALAPLVPDPYKPLVPSTILQSLIDIALKSETLAEVEKLLPQISKILAKEELKPDDLTSLLTAGISIAKNSATEIQALAGNQNIINALIAAAPPEYQLIINKAVLPKITKIMLSEEGINLIQDLVPNLLVFLPNPFTTKTQKEVDQDKIEAVFNICDSIVNSEITFKMAGEVIAPLIQNNKKEIEGLLLKATNGAISIDCDKLLSTISDPDALKKLSKAYTQFRKGEKLGALVTALTSSADVRSLAWNAMIDLLGVKIKALIMPDFMKRYFAGDAVKQNITSKLSDKKDLDEIFFTLQQTKDKSLNWPDSSIYQHTLSTHSLSGYDLTDIDFKGVKINVDMSNTIFHRRANFEGAVITEKANFNKAHFHQELNLKNATIDSGALANLLPAIEKIPQDKLNLEGIKIPLINMKQKDMEYLFANQDNPIIKHGLINEIAVILNTDAKAAEVQLSNAKSIDDFKALIQPSISLKAPTFVERISQHISGAHHSLDRHS